MSHIAWTNEVWNPLTGCDKVGQGCKNCYAEIMSRRLRAMGQTGYFDAVDDKGHWTGKITLLEDQLQKPYHWKKPRMVFVNSMSDLFHKNVPQEFINKVVRVMQNNPRHTFQVLTKRYDRPFLALYPQDASKNIYIGFSICNQDDADKARRYLRMVADDWKTFVSYEPALSNIDWTGYDFIDWMICGGESGTDRRPFELEWAYSARNFCKSHGIPFFMKQDGGLRPGERGQIPDDLWIREYPEGMLTQEKTGL